MERLESESPQVRMTDEEAREVMKVLAERREIREERLAMPTVGDVAQMANTDNEDVLSALAQVRASRVPPVHQSQVQPGIRRALFAVAAMVLAMLLLWAFVGPTTVQTTPPPVPDTTTIAPPPPAWTPPGSPTHDSAATASGAPLPDSAATAN